MKGKIKQVIDSLKINQLFKVILDNLFSLFKIFLCCFIVVYGISNYIINVHFVSGQSMFPAIKNGEVVIGNAFEAKFGSIKRGDIVIVKTGLRNQDYFIKRVIGLPNETISCSNDKIYINGKELNEPYLISEYSQTIRDTGELFNEKFSSAKLGNDEYFLMGDNRINSIDSRDLGPFHRNQIKAVGVFIVFPFTRMGKAN